MQSGWVGPHFTMRLLTVVLNSASFLLTKGQISTPGTWTARLPLYEPAARHSQPLWVYANVVYPLDAPVTGAGYYYATYTATKFNLSSLAHVVAADELEAAGRRFRGSSRPDRTPRAGP